MRERLELLDGSCTPLDATIDSCHSMHATSMISVRSNRLAAVLVTGAWRRHVIAGEKNICTQIIGQGPSRHSPRSYGPQAELTRPKRAQRGSEHRNGTYAKTSTSGPRHSDSTAHNVPTVRFRSDVPPGPTVVLVAVDSLLPLRAAVAAPGMVETLKASAGSVRTGENTVLLAPGSTKPGEVPPHQRHRPGEVCREAPVKPK
jgi:hypothetical protein